MMDIYFPLKVSVLAVSEKTRFTDDHAIHM